MQLGDMMKIHIFAAILLLILPIVSAVDYGDGNYGDGIYPPEEDGGGGGGGGGGNYAPPASDTETITRTLTPEFPQEFLFSKAQISVTSIVLDVLNPAAEVKIGITPLDTKPMTLSSPPQDRFINVYKYLNIEKRNIVDTNIKSAKIKFVVNKSWLREKGLMAENVVLLRWKDNQWNELLTDIETNGIDSVTFAATSPGLSYFAIATKTYIPVIQITNNTNTSAAIQPQPEKNTTKNGTGVGEDLESSNAEKKKLTSGFPKIFMYAFGMILVLGAILLLFVRQHKPPKIDLAQGDSNISPTDRSKILQYVHRARSLKIDDYQISQALKKVGLNDEQIMSFDVDPKKPKE